LHNLGLINLSADDEIPVDANGDYTAVCVDGGVINNEPYDLTEKLLEIRRRTEKGKSEDVEKAEE
jgi:hypothetical protein